MIGAMLMAMALQAAPAVDGERLELGKRLARTGTLATLLPLMAQKETEEMVAGQPGLTADEQAKLRAAARAAFERRSAELLDAEGAAYAKALSADDLRTLVAAAESAAGKRQRAALPQVIMGTMAAMQGVDFKGETLRAFCAETGKGCTPAK